MGIFVDWLSTAFVVTWIVLGVGSFLVHRKMNLAAKKRWAPRMMIFSGVLFTGFVTALSVRGKNDWSGLWVLAVVVPAVTLIGYLNLRFTKICEHCGTSTYNHNWLIPMNFCPKCGEEYERRKDKSIE